MAALAVLLVVVQMNLASRSGARLGSRTSAGPTWPSSYERAYGKLLDNMLLGDLSLKANIGGTVLLIFPSDKLPERIQRWNGLLFFWGIFYARKESSPLELPTNNCPLEQINGLIMQHVMGSPKALQPLGIDLNECPNDDISDLALSLGSESEKSGASVDQNI